ncbi:PepSY domain-containing protein [Neisseria sp. WLZKY-1]|uniref:PepSY domain-containing protein n=1 Tax=unclassified Neisseria TaxID=2623750 RepID=UPI0002A3E0D0|nr:PepSY domain-containing protein [Neisseria sp. oral taxon 020]EKY10045.1 hypothetical protein HMPREF9120_00154 [Neisseria sp. oral taxon 020 str. F0370]
MKKLILAAAVTLMAATAAAHDRHDYREDREDRIEAQIYDDPNFDANLDKAEKILERQGYQVHDIEPDVYRGKPALDIEATKDGRDYDIKMSYPALKILSKKIDR